MTPTVASKTRKDVLWTFLVNRKHPRSIGTSPSSGLSPWLTPGSGSFLPLLAGSSYSFASPFRLVDVVSSPYGAFPPSLCLFFPILSVLQNPLTCSGFRAKKGEMFCRSGPDRNGKRKRVMVWPEKGTRKKKRSRRRRRKDGERIQAKENRDTALASADHRHCETHDLGILFHRHFPAPTAWQIVQVLFYKLNHKQCVFRTKAFLWC